MIVLAIACALMMVVIVALGTTLHSANARAASHGSSSGGGGSCLKPSEPIDGAHVLVENVDGGKTLEIGDVEAKADAEA